MIVLSTDLYFTMMITLVQTKQLYAHASFNDSISFYIFEIRKYPYEVPFEVNKWLQKIFKLVILQVFVQNIFQDSKVWMSDHLRDFNKSYNPSIYVFVVINCVVNQVFKSGNFNMLPF